MNKENYVTLMDSTINTISDMEKILDDMSEKYTQPPYKEEPEPKSYTLELAGNPNRYYNFRIVETNEHYPAHAFIRLYDNGLTTGAGDHYREWHEDVTLTNIRDHIDINDLPSITGVEDSAFTKESAVQIWKVLVDKYGFVEKK
tara:strand:- start:702 stop:1133 length:432 start_codon:yes stop_codon:yes gene_type:complete